MSDAPHIPLAVRSASTQERQGLVTYWSHRVSTGRPGGLAAAGLLAVGLLAACGSDDPAPEPSGTDPSGSAAAVECESPGSCELPDDVIAAARQEGAVTLYSGTTIGEGLLARFQEKYGIQVTNITVGGAENAQRFLAEADAGDVQADMFLTNDVQLIGDHTEYFLPVTEELLPNVADLPAVWRTDQAFGWLSPPTGIIYNTELIPADQVPETWDDLLQPEYEGKLCYSDPRASNTPRQLLTTLVKDKGVEYLEELAAQDPRIVPGNSIPAAQAVAAGDCAITIPNFPGSTFTDLVDSGAPVEWLQPTEPTLFNPGFATVPANSPHPNAARVLANFYLSDEGAELLCEGVTYYVPADPTGEHGCFPAEDPALLDTTGTDEEFEQYLDILGIE